ncbi:glycoside hydrolase family 28 protein [Plebeiibacterium sediminum]|uniref:Glycosyl hydrolase family 28 protein n=1 Tax=Plebeiibacterium sediminum TaxID=2992112 RepID=A0AAE3M4E3_9BACT|nr:glycosyl hydrolase family 28 protein [Plebeiobacterium sediminum]MCW3786445.1 glycosyl hydrolase family 28 protein [Plebeiobacterium sediminum]
MADSLMKDLSKLNKPNATYNVNDYGAIADSLTLNTKAIQQAIDTCANNGGGIVLFPEGNYVTGTIELKSNVYLNVDKNARIIGSTDIKDYPDHIESLKSIMSESYEFKQSLIYGEKLTNIGIIGNGEIYFRGEKEYFGGPETQTLIVDRPLGIRIIECKNVIVKDIHLSNSAAWMQNYLHCENLLFKNMTVNNHANFNNDGLDLDGCKNAVVDGCFINAEDDAMCFKGASFYDTENIIVKNSTFLSTCNGFKIGTDTQGSFRNIIARNLILGGIPDSLESFRGHEASTGITLVTVDGGTVENIILTDITINQSRCPIFLRIGDRGRVMKGMPKPEPGSLQNIIIKNIDGKDNYTQGSLITGMEGYPVENVIIKDMNISMQGGGTDSMAHATVPEDIAGYPDAHQFNREGLPAYGFYIRHAKNLILQNVKITTDSIDARPEFKYGNNVENVIINNKIIN